MSIFPTCSGLPQVFQYLFEEAPTLSANLENKVKHVLSSPTVLKMVTWSYRLRFFIVLIVKIYYVSALVTFCGVE